MNLIVFRNVNEKLDEYRTSLKYSSDTGLDLAEQTGNTFKKCK
ncbi:MAG: hypothetical protein SCARUB_03349 [Candidatus Scalindua rubra]|uniref:Uncharacterized protein n=1 Tax=Candidatus Scalindua rubra TaxID=1872076 RepID=A0A1E3X7B2_9BACT|nr:MAG: hypothetical protein SCARUB_03349 [Candidatus Scalindua rubra]